MNPVYVIEDYSEIIRQKSFLWYNHQWVILQQNGNSFDRFALLRNLFPRSIKTQLMPAGIDTEVFGKSRDFKKE